MNGPRRKKWAKRVRGGQLELTDHAVRQLMFEGQDMARDGLGNYLDEESLSDAAMDSAAYHMELTTDGVPEGYDEILRQCAADYIYEGMLKGAREKKEENLQSPDPLSTP